MQPREEYFARVAPLLGQGLRGRRVAAENLSLTGRVIELLAACMLEEVVVLDDREAVGWPLRATCRGPALATEPCSARDLLARHLAWKNGFVPLRWHRRGRADLHLRGRVLSLGETPHVTWDTARRAVTLHVPPGDLFAHENLAYHVARDARDLLLGRRGWPPPVTFHGHGLWPFAIATRPASAPRPAPPPARVAHVLVVGCGSLGSEALRLLAGSPLRFTLVDDGRVSPFNPARQWFGTDDIGEPKVAVLSRLLAPAPVRALRVHLAEDTLPELGRLLDEDPPALALLATGTADHGPLAELLWRRQIPHLAACAYPQARYFEVSVVLPGTPCLCCLRGHLFAGPASAAPMTDEVARFLYRDLAPGERDRLYQDLVAEPATRIETGRAAAVLAHCALEALAPPDARSPWFQRLLAEQTTCLLGGNVAERDADGQPAYGLTYPGQVVRLGLPDLVGVEARRVCPVCGRELQIGQRIELPVASPEEIDRALLA